MRFTINEVLEHLPEGVSRCWLYALLGSASVGTELRGSGLTNLYDEKLAKDAIMERYDHLKKSNSARKEWNLKRAEVRLKAVFFAIEKVKVKCK